MTKEQKITFHSNNIKSDNEAVEIAHTIDNAFTSTFSLRRVSLGFVEMLLGYILSLIIEEPLLAFSHFIRTGIFKLSRDPFSFLLQVCFLSVLIIILYFISRPIRHSIEERLEDGEQMLVSRMISLIFAVLFTDIFIEPLMGIASWITSGFSNYEYDIGYLIDRIIMGIVLLLLLVLIYYIIRKTQMQKTLKRKRVS